MDHEVPLGLAARQDRVVADHVLAVEGADEILADHDLGVGHLLFQVGGPIVLTGVVDLLDPRHEVGPARDVASRQRPQADVHSVSVGGCACASPGCVTALSGGNK